MKKTVLAAAFAAVGGVALATTDVMMFFDTEDYTTSRSDDSVLEIANLLKEEGVVGNFDVVGFWAQKIIENRRFDVIDSLKGHTIGTQSLYHSLHPTECEWAGREDAREAYRLVHEHEAMCVGMLRAAFGLDRIHYMTEPGNSGTYIANTVGYDLGMTVGYGMLPSATYGMWYDNLFQLPYDWSIESMIPPNPEPDYGKLLDDWAKRPFMCLAMHPDKVRSTTHWDIVNYREKNLVEWRQWNEAPRRVETDVQEFYRRLRKLCRALKTDPRFNVTDVHACIARLKPRRALTPADLPAIEAALKEGFGPVSVPGSYCVADVFQAAARFLLGERSFLPKKAYGFLSQPVGVSSETTVRAADLRAAAAKLDFTWYLPPSIEVGGQTIGPADFLFAALEVLRTGAETVTVSPREQLGSFDRMPRWKDFEYVRGWIIHARDLADRILSDRLRWQLWTLRYEWTSEEEREAPRPLDLQARIDAAPAGGTVRVPAGRWEVKPFRLKGDLTLELDDRAVVYASTNLADYASAEGEKTFVSATDAANLTICGKGVLDGRGAVFKERGGLKGEDQPQALPVMLRFTRCRNLKLKDFTYRDGGAWGCHLRNCDGVTVKGVTCFNHVNETNDGIDIESRNVTIEDCDIDADDDAIVFKTESDRSFPVTNVVIRNCRMASCCNALKFGTGSYCDVRDVLVENCRFDRPKGNFRFNWKKVYASRGVREDLVGLGGMALEVVDGGRMENVTIRNIDLDGYIVPIFIRLARRHEAADPRGSYLRNVLIENVKGACALSRNGCSITGVPGLRPENITLRNISLRFPGGGTAADAKPGVPEVEKAYPEGVMFGRNLPAWGFYLRHADAVVFENVTLSLAGEDAREAIVAEDSTGDWKPVLVR